MNKSKHFYLNYKVVEPTYSNSNYFETPVTFEKVQRMKVRDSKKISNNR